MIYFNIRLPGDYDLHVCSNNIWDPLRNNFFFLMNVIEMFCVQKILDVQSQKPHSYCYWINGIVRK